MPPRDWFTLCTTVWTWTSSTVRRKGSLTVWFLSVFFYAKLKKKKIPTTRSRSYRTLLLRWCTWPHLSLLVFFCSLKYEYYRKRGSASHIIGSAEALPILCVRYFRWERERYRERERRKWRHHFRAKIGDELTLSLAKIRTIGDELTLSLAKNSHFSFLPSHFPSLPSQRGHHCGAENRNEFTLSIAKKFFALFVPPLSNGAGSREKGPYGIFGDF